MSDVPGHFCPACGTPLKAFLRYPWHLCRDCRNRAADGTGSALEFGNEGFSGGFMYRYAGDGDDDWVTCRAVIALVDKRPVYITEARFGGVVAEPLLDRTLHDTDRVVDLRRRGRTAKSGPATGSANTGRPSSKG